MCSVQGIFEILIPSNPSKEETILVNEVLTPDPSSYLPVVRHAPGKLQPDLDKQIPGSGKHTQKGAQA